MAAESFACSLSPQASLQFLEQSYAFHGRVTGFEEDALRPFGGRALPTAPAERPRAGAVTVEVLASVQLPHPAAHYAVFPVGLAADCGVIFNSLLAISEDYSIGDEVIVVARALSGESQTENFPLILSNPSIMVRVEDMEVLGFSSSPWPPMIGNEFALNVEALRLDQNYPRPLDLLRQDHDLPVLDAQARWQSRPRLIYELVSDIAELRGSGEDVDVVRRLFKIYMYTSELLAQCDYSALVEQYLPDKDLQDELAMLLLQWSARWGLFSPCQ
tara:strand:- start:127255 stop:128073 length:819 start_codon:yes stop_codon:yes gene_type:complete